LQRAEGPVPVGSGAQLHARDEPALEPQREQHAHEQEHDDSHGLEEPDPAVVLREVRDRHRVGEDEVHAVTSAVARATATTLPAPVRSVARTWEPGEFPGTHTTWSTIAVTSAGRVIVPCSALTASWSPSVTPTAAAGAAEGRATGRLAVPARNASPSWARPRSSRSRQVARTAWPGATTTTGWAATAGALARDPSQRPSAASSACTTSAVARPRSTSSSSASAVSTR